MATSRSFGGEVGDVALADEDARRASTSSRPGHHAQRGRLAGAGGADEDHELAVGDLEVERVDGWRARSRGRSRRLDEADVSHQSTST